MGSFARGTQCKVSFVADGAMSRTLSLDNQAIATSEHSITGCDVATGKRPAFPIKPREST
jgi:predicted ATP-grasp superfamily ATP-dependent carboligase